MKYYFVTADGEELALDLSHNGKLEGGIQSYQICSGENNTTRPVYVKSLAGKNFVSEDKKSWKKLARISSLKGVVSNANSMKVYRGFRPSGIGNANAGDLITDMPGKVVKVITAKGAMVSPGDTLLILEAMKMENEIKASISGKVKAVHVTEGQAIDAGHLMLEIEALSTQ